MLRYDNVRIKIEIIITMTKIITILLLIITTIIAIATTAVIAQVELIP